MGNYSASGPGSASDEDREEEMRDEPGTQSSLDEVESDGVTVDNEDENNTGPGVGPGTGAGVGAGTAAGIGSGGVGGPVKGPGGGVTEPPDVDEPEESGKEQDSGEEQDDSSDIDDNEEVERDGRRRDDRDSDDSNDENEEEEEREDDDDDEDEEDETVVVQQRVDPLSALSWGVQPVLRRVQERYGDQVKVNYRPAPIREFEDPEREKQRWVDVGNEIGMPVDPSFWDRNPVESTELVNRGFEAAIRQQRGLSYLRAVWRRAIAEAKSIDEDGLAKVASQIGLDTERFRRDLEEIDLESRDSSQQLPVTEMEINGRDKTLTGRVRYTDFHTKFQFQGLKEQELQDLSGFVDQYGPVATPEVMEVYEIGEKDEAVQRLQDLNDVSSFEVGGEQFWFA